MASTIGIQRFSSECRVDDRARAAGGAVAGGAEKSGSPAPPGVSTGVNVKLALPRFGGGSEGGVAEGGAVGAVAESRQGGGSGGRTAGSGGGNGRRCLLWRVIVSLYLCRGGLGAGRAEVLVAIEAVESRAAGWRALG